MNTTKQISAKSLTNFLLSQIENTKTLIQLIEQSSQLTIELLSKSDEIIEDDNVEKFTFIACNPAEKEIILQSLGSRKKILRGKIRNNEGHLKRNDKPEWTENDYEKAIKQRKVQLAEVDMLLTKIQNLIPF